MLKLQKIMLCCTAHEMRSRLCSLSAPITLPAILLSQLQFAYVGPSDMVGNDAALNFRETSLHVEQNSFPEETFLNLFEKFSKSMVP